MAPSNEPASLWWPEERIRATLSAKYVLHRLRPAAHSRLHQLPRWGEGLTSETYLDWILDKAGRLFLILSDVGIAERIFALVDESVDDDNLPVAEQNVDRLFLSAHGPSPALDAKFFRAQWRFLVRGIREGEHVTYTGNEGVPVEVCSHSGSNAGLQGREETVDKVILAGSVSRVLMRTQVQVGGAPHFFSVEEVLDETRSLRQLAHEHVVSVYASYFVDDTVCVLFTGAAAVCSLHNFLTDEPAAFKRLPKERRREILIGWPHCLASALAWLHAHGHAHGAIRPSNVLVDTNFHVCLGQFQALDSLLAPPKLNNLEAYQYSAPERWLRPVAPVVQTSPSRTLLPSGGRTAPRKRASRRTLSPLNESLPSSPNPPRPNSAASKGPTARIGLPGSPSRFSFTVSSSSSSFSASASASSTSNSGNPSKQQQRSSTWTSNPSTNPSTAPSIISSKSSSTSTSTSSSASATPTQQTVLHTRIQHHQPNSTTSGDIFSLGAITLDILTHLSKRSLSNFVSHRSARNRTAGRGGGIGDASFHLARNAVQIQSWMSGLEDDARKRRRRARETDRVFWAVPRILGLVREMMNPDPGERPTAGDVVEGFVGVVELIPSSNEGRNIALHCEGEKGETQQRMKLNGSTEYGKETLEAQRAKAKTTDDEEAVFLSSPVSEFDFGFLDGVSERVR